MSKRATTATATALPIEEAIERAGGLPVEVVFGLDLLERSQPLWPVDADAWSAVIGTVVAFADRWDGQARAAGWSSLELYGLHSIAPWAGISGMGGAFVVARCGHHVVDVTAMAIKVRSRAGANLRVFRRSLSVPSVLAWSLCPATRS